MKGLFCYLLIYAVFTIGSHEVLAVSHVLSNGTAVTNTAQEAVSWLDKMVLAISKQGYQGNIIYQQGNNLQSMAVIHGFDEGIEKERILFLDGVPKEVIRVGGKLLYASADKGATRFNQGLLFSFGKKITRENISNHYHFKMVGGDRVAGRRAIVLEVLPSDRYRYGYMLWLDYESAVPLKSYMVDDKTNVIERMQFVRFQLMNRLDAKEKEMFTAVLRKHEEEKSLDKEEARDPEIGKDALSSYATQPAENAWKPLWGWAAGWLPDGFDLANYGERVSPVSPQRVDTAVYSDGLASFSIFVEPDKGKVLSQASERMGVLSVVSKVFRSGENFFHVTVVGDVPPGTAERIAVSVRPDEKRINNIPDAG
ncbi:Sigma factor AlgU regulatory protein MucB [invertebrate metagenome]|uniref:Sigma factor AlgU regulatory protein MucB n=1 Tax=invertebrate metagenome TaxID=1711999 RepID=A0A2H9T878_9ZZZZ